MFTEMKWFYFAYYLPEYWTVPGGIDVFNWGIIGALLDLFKKPGLSISIVEEQLFAAWSPITSRVKSKTSIGC